MEISPTLQLHTAIKALTDVVLPAVDPANKLAQEQVQLVIGTLNILVQRYPLIYRYQRDELSRFLALADSLKSQTAELPGAEPALHALARSVEAGADVLDRARAEPSELESANLDLREKIGALIAGIYSETATSKLNHVSSIVLAHAKEQLLRERSWLIGQGWEADPKSVPAIETLI